MGDSNNIIKADSNGVVSRIKYAQDPMGGMGAPPMDPMMGGGGMGGMPPPAPMGGDMGVPPPTGAMPGATDPERNADLSDDDLEKEVPEDVKASIKQKVKEKVQEKVQEITGQPAEELPEGDAEGMEGMEGIPTGEEGMEGVEGMPTGEEGMEEVPMEEEGVTEVTGKSVEELPSIIDQMDEDQFMDLFESAKEIFLGEGGSGSEGSEDKKGLSSEDKLREGADLEPPEDLIKASSDDLFMKKIASSEKEVKPIKRLVYDPKVLKVATKDKEKGVLIPLKKYADIVFGHMETDGRYYVSCPNTNVKAMIGIPRIHPISQCKNCPYYGDNGDNVGGNMSQIFCSYTEGESTPVRYIPIETSEALREKESDTTLPFAHLIKDSGDEEDVSKEAKVATKIPVKTAETIVEVRQNQVVEQKKDLGDVDIDGENYTVKRNGNDLEVYKSGTLVDTIKGAINYNDDLVRENELVARLLRSPAVQTKLDNRRAFYNPLGSFRKYASEMSERQALKSVIQQQSWDQDNVDDFVNIVNDNGYSIVLTSQDKKWIKRCVNKSPETKSAFDVKDVKKVKVNWEDEFFKKKI